MISRLLFLCAGVLATAGAAPETYTLDPVHSSVTFAAKTLFTPIHGSFLLGGGTMVYDPADPAACKVEAVIPLGSVNTRNDMRDKNITTKEGWFAAAKFPEARFTSRRWEKLAADRYRITGDFSLNGIKREIVLVASHLGSGPGLEPGSHVAGWEGTVTLDRTVFGVTADTKIIAPSIPVTITLQAVRQKAAAP